jgi:hypothetical protein
MNQSVFIAPPRRQKVGRQIYQEVEKLALPQQMEVLDFVKLILPKSKATSSPTAKLPVFGCAKGRFRMTEDFDAPLEDFKDYM